MTLTPDNKIDLSDYRLQKARKFLDAANILCDGSRFESSVNRSYYSILSAAKALLVLRGIDPETHEGTKTMLSKEFIRTGLLPQEFGEIFRNIQSRRLDSDYGDYVEISKDEARDSVAKAKIFVERIAELMEKIKHAQRGS